MNSRCINKQIGRSARFLPLPTNNFFLLMQSLINDRMIISQSLVKLITKIRLMQANMKRSKGSKPIQIMFKTWRSIITNCQIVRIFRSLSYSFQSFSKGEYNYYSPGKTSFRNCQLNGDVTSREIHSSSSASSSHFTKGSSDLTKFCLPYC